MPGRPQAGLKTPVRYNMYLPTAPFPTKVYGLFKLSAASVISCLYFPIFLPATAKSQKLRLKRWYL